MTRPSKWLSFSLLLSLIATARGLDAESALVPGFKTTTQLVLVPVTVVDRNGKTLSNLQAEDFKIFEDQKPQRIVSFSSEDAACSVGLVLDVSGSMRNTLGRMKGAAHELLGVSDPSDEFFLFAVSSVPVALSGFTTDFEMLENQVALAPVGGWTALIDTVYGGLSKMRTAAHPRRALVVLSDGMDNHSRYSKHELLQAALEAGTQIHTIAIDDASGYLKPIERVEARQGQNFLRQLAEKTGGLSCVVGNSADMQKAITHVAQALRHQYVIGYSPEDAGQAGKWRRISVKSQVPGARIYARSGYQQ